MKKFIIVFGIVVSLSFLGFASGVLANPLAFLFPGATATATSTTSYMTAGTATTTLTCDSYSANCTTSVNPTGRPLGFNRVALLVALSASSTGPTTRINTEYSQDGIDWYQDGGSGVETFATTTKPYDVSQVAQYNFAFASSTAGLGALSASSATTTRMIILKAPTRFIRAIFTVPVGSSPVGVWAQMVPTREASN